ncbi:MAG: FUSC family protein [Pigmentiphaga sp.]|nr:FUSC family protein [Pigmentiphaga sp.]
MSNAASSFHPNSWLRELSHLNPARWRWGRSLRAALGIGLPLAIGLATHTLEYTLWIAMGTLFQSVGERDGPYQAIFRKILVSAPLGAAGYLLGYLSGLPWGLLIAIMVLVAFLSGIISTYSSALSTGALQFLVMGAVAIGNPEIGQFWHASLLLLTGTVLYAAMLGVEILIYPQRPQREMTASLVRALSELARSRAEGKTFEAQRRQVTTHQSALYSLLMQIRYHAAGRNQHLESTAAVLQRFDVLFPLLLSVSEAPELRAAADALDGMAAAFSAGRKRPAPAVAHDTTPLGRAVAGLGDALWGDPAALPSLATARPAARESRLAIHLDRLNPGRNAVLSAMALALCTGIGYSLHWVDGKSHWYWVPMTIAIVMKPDLGSIFARAIHRSVGTIGGVAIGATLLTVVPVGPAFILLISLIALFLPWASQRSYALSALTLTPLVLILIDFVSPEAAGVHYATLRLVDTLLGSAITLVFGYLIWPKRHARELNQALRGARQAIAAYLRAVVPSAAAAKAGLCRRAAYGQLADMRAALQKSLAEPPPAGREAAAWFPLVTGAERMCDAITAYSTVASPQPDAGEAAALARLASLIDHDGRPAPGDLPRLPAASDSPEARLLERLDEEMTSLLELASPARRAKTHA